MPVLTYINPLPLIRPILLPPIHIATFLVNSVGWTLTQFNKLMPSEALVQFLTTALFLGLTLGTIIALVHYYILRCFNLSPMSQHRMNGSQYGSRRLGKRSYERGGYSRYGREREDEMGYTSFFGGRMEKILEEEEEEGW